MTGFNAPAASGLKTARPMRSLVGDTWRGFSHSRSDGVLNASNMLLLAQFRWIAVCGQVLTIAIAASVLGFRLPLIWHLFVLALLVAFNAATSLWLRNRREVAPHHVALALAIDVAALTAQLWLSGGTANPFLAIYLLQITLAAVMLDTLKASLILAEVVTGLCVLTFSVWPLVATDRTPFRVETLDEAGTVIALVLDGVLLLVLVTRISRHLRERNAALEAMRRHAAEEAHIVSMGLLASGAAHELGTPLASIDVVLSDWARLAPLEGDPNFQTDLAEMQAAIRRCKVIVQNILLSAGDAGGATAEQTTLHSLVDGIAQEWRTRRQGGARLHLDMRVGEDMAVVSHALFRQALFNLLDNAFEAASSEITLSVQQDGNTFRFTVSDDGPGFPEEVLSTAGQPYRSTKGQDGRGLGLFLVFNVSRKLGGRTVLNNRPTGGAEVSLHLPVSAILIGARDVHRTSASADR